MEAIILGSPYDIVLGAITPIDIPAYESEKAVIQLTDGYNPYLIGGGTTPTDSYWFRYSTGILRPLTSTDSVVIGGTTLAGTEQFRVIGKIHTTSLQLGSTVTITSILDEDNMVSDSNTAVPTQQSVKAYVDNQVGGYLQAGDNISLLTNNSGYIITETDPIFTASASYAITSTQITHWDTAYGWGDHALVGYITIETDPVFVASIAHSIVAGDITNWNLAYTNNHTHSNKTVLDIIIGSGAGTQALFDDGTYKTVLTSIAGSDTQIIYNNAGAYAGSSFMTFDGSITYIDTVRVASTLQIGDYSTTITKDGSNNLTFYDAVVGTSYTLAALVGTATNFWTPSGSNIWYGYKVGVGGTGTFTEALEVTGNILADNFSSKYFRYNSNGNLLLGPAAGDQETGVSKLYIHNNNSTTPLIYGDFTTLDLTFGGNVTIPNARAVIFGTSAVEIYTDVSNNLIFKDAVANGGAALTLSDLRSGAYYSLIASFADYATVTLITTADKAIWNKASYITITGDGTKYLSDNGVYNTITGTLVVTDNILKWDTSTFRPYATKSEAGGASSNGKFYRAATDYPTATTQLVYDGDYYSTNLYTRSLEIGNYLLYRGGSPSGTILTIRDWTDDWTIVRVANDNESTLAMVVVDGAGEDLHVMDFYNQVYSSPKMGIRMYAHDVSTTFRPFYIEYSNGGIEYQAITILPRTTLTSNDTEVKIGNVLSIIDSTTYITRDVSTNLTFTDAITGTKTLAQLAAGTTIVSDILYWNSSTNKLTPYSASTTGCFDSSSTSPTHTTRLNYDGYLHATTFTAYNAESGVYGVSVFPTLAAEIGIYCDVSSITAPENGTGIYSVTTTGIAVKGESTSTGAGIQGISDNGVGVFGQCNGASGNGMYAQCTGNGTALFANASGTGASISSIANSGYGVQSTSSSNIGVYAISYTSNALAALQNSSSITTNHVVTVNRTSAVGTHNITGDIINITDNPSTTGTVSGSVLKATIGSTVRIDMNPRVIDSVSAVAYTFDTANSLITAGSKLISIKNQGTELSYFDKYGSFHIGDASASFLELSKSTLQIKVSSTFRMNFIPSVSDGASAVAYMFSTTSSLSTTGAKIISIKNQNTEKVSIDKDGVIEITTVGQGIILASPDGTRYKITVANGGTLAVTAV